MKINNNNRINSNLLIFFSNFLILLFFYFFYNCNYAELDDYLMKLISSGAYGHSDIHLVYISSIIGIVLKFLYLNFPSISWYDILQLILIYVSLTVISCIIYRKKSTRLIKIIYYGFLLFIAYDVYVNIEFTKTAALLTISGSLALNECIKNDKNIIFSAFVLLLGFMMRKEIFIACLIVISPLLMYTLFFEKKIKKYLISLLLFFFCIF